MVKLQDETAFKAFATLVHSKNVSCTNYCKMQPNSHELNFSLFIMLYLPKTNVKIRQDSPLLIPRGEITAAQRQKKVQMSREI